MSKPPYIWRTKDHLIRAGWDNPLQTYYAQVYHHPEIIDEATGEPVMVAWLGCWSYEIGTVKELASLLRPYTAIPMEVEELLERDGTFKTPPTPLQQKMAKLVELAVGRR